LDIFKSRLAFGQQRLVEPEAAGLSSAEANRDAEQAFLADIANLPAEERERKLQKHRWYVRLAQRQGIAEAEWRMEQYHLTGDERYKF
jgi:hypothetical protein